MTSKKLPFDVEMRDVKTLQPHPKNPRTHPDKQIDGLAGAFDEFGIKSMLVVDENGMILAGEGRWLAGRKAKQAAMPVIVVKGWSDKKKIAFMLSDNRWAQLGGFDDTKLRQAVEELHLADYDFEPVGYSVPDIAEILARATDGEGDPEEVPEPKSKPSVRLGDLWLLGEHRLLCGDSTKADDVGAVLGTAKPMLMVTDPPYGVSYDPKWRLESGINKAHQTRAEGKVQNDDQSDWTKAWALFPGDVAYVWHGGLHSGNVAANLQAAGFVLRAQIIWNKASLVIGRGDYHWKHEPCWYAVRKGGKGWWAGDRKQSTVWDIANMHRTQGVVDDGKTDHGTQKPIECMKRPIENNSRKGASVYEPFSGSGTTIVACEMTGRKCIAIELDPTYVQMAIERWQKFTGKLATLDGRTLEQVAKARLKGLPTGKKADVSSLSNKK